VVVINETPISLDDIAAISALAGGIIPPDEHDAGAAAVHAGPTIAGRIRLSPYADIYLAGLADARSFANSMFDCRVQDTNASQMHDLLGKLSDESPDFFRQLRSDVCIFYLSDPGVWQRIGFPGESTDKGGYPDFDQPQSRTES
jgi:hypothetical protein